MWSVLCPEWETPQSCKWRKGCWWRSLFPQLCILQPLFHISAAHSSSSLTLPHWQDDNSFCACDPVFNTFFFHAVRNAFWKWGEDEGRKKVLKLPCSVVQVLCLLANPMGGSPTLNQLRKPSSLFAALYLIFLRKHSKQERETRLRLRAGLSSCSRRPSAIWIKSACLSLGLDMSLRHSKGRFFLSLRNESNWGAKYLTQYSEFSCSLPTNIVCCLTNWFAVEISPCCLWWARYYGQGKLMCFLSSVSLQVC